MTIAGANYREGVAFDSNGAMYVTLSGGTDVAVADGGTGASTAQGAAKNLGVPYLLSACGIPFIHLSSGSVAAGGGISGITALPLTYANAYCYFPANILATTIAAGWYYCTFSNTTTGTAFLNTYTSGTPTIPASPTAVTDGKGAFTGDTTERNGPAISLPAGSMGANGALRILTRWSSTSNANAKTVGLKANTTAIIPGMTMTSVLNLDSFHHIQNRGVQTAQVGAGNAGASYGPGTSASARIQSAVDFSAAQTLNLNFTTKGTATDNLILEGYMIEVLYVA